MQWTMNGQGVEWLSAWVISQFRALMTSFYSPQESKNPDDASDLPVLLSASKFLVYLFSAISQRI